MEKVTKTSSTMAHATSKFRFSLPSSRVSSHLLVAQTANTMKNGIVTQKYCIHDGVGSRQMRIRANPSVAARRAAGVTIPRRINSTTTRKNNIVNCSLSSTRASKNTHEQD